MEITETKNEGLKRAYKITVPNADIESRVKSRLGEIAQTARMPGFRPGKVPVTVLSRCQRFDLKRIPSGVLEKHLKEILEKEGIEWEDAAIQYLVEASEGSARDALSLMDQAVNMTEGKVTAALVEAMLGYARGQDITLLLERLFQGECKKSLDLFRALQRG